MTWVTKRLTCQNRRPYPASSFTTAPLNLPEIVGLVLMALLLPLIGVVGGAVLLLSVTVLLLTLNFMPGGLLLSFALALASLISCGRYSWAHLPSLHRGAQLRRLARRLGTGWKAYLPDSLHAQHQARVLISPGGQAFYLGIVKGRAVPKYGQPQVGWRGLLDAHLRQLHLADDALIR